MRTNSILIAIASLLVAGALSIVTAILAVNAVEARSATAINNALTKEGITWVTVESDGLRARLTGTAPDEAIRFRAVSIAGSVLDSSRVADDIDVTPTRPLAAPKFSLELLRNAAGVSMIGLIPDGEDRATIAKSAAEAAGKADVTDMLDTARYAPSERWDDALKLGLEAMEMLPKSKISIEEGRVFVSAVSDSRDQQQAIERTLNRKTPDGVQLILNVTSPRPVIAPFTLRFVREDSVGQMNACSAHTPLGRAQILAAARLADMNDQPPCPLGLGVPDPSWPDAVVAGLKAVAQLENSTLTFSDTDVTVIFGKGTSAALHDRIKGELEADLPDVFTLNTVLPEPDPEDDEDSGLPEFVATRSPEGQVQLRGRVTDDLMRSAAESFAHSRFGHEDVYAAMITDDTLPAGWPMRVLTGLEALARLEIGSLIIQPDYIELTGVTKQEDTQTLITQLFNERLGEGQNFNFDITYIAPPTPEEIALNPEKCVDDVNAAQNGAKITFAPGSTEIQGGSLETIDAIADILRECSDVTIEVAGYTDSQGREEMNQQLSLQRAESVVLALISRRVLVRNLIANGYGEADPIADNGTQDGREANRRIEFRLIQPDGAVAEASPPDAETTEETSNEQN